MSIKHKVNGEKHVESKVGVINSFYARLSLAVC